MPRMAKYSSESGSITVTVVNGLSRTYGPGSVVNLDEQVTPNQTLEQALGKYMSLFEPVEQKPKYEHSTPRSFETATKQPSIEEEEKE